MDKKKWRRRIICDQVIVCQTQAAARGRTRHEEPVGGSRNQLIEMIVRLCNLTKFLTRLASEIGRSDEVIDHLQGGAKRVYLAQKPFNYEVPEVIALPIIAGSTDYLAWIAATTRQP